MLYVSYLSGSSPNRERRILAFKNREALREYVNGLYAHHGVYFNTMTTVDTLISALRDVRYTDAKREHSRELTAKEKKEALT